MYHDNDEFPVPYSLDVELRCLRDAFRKNAKELHEQAVREERAAAVLDAVARQSVAQREEITSLKKKLEEAKQALLDRDTVRKRAKAAKGKTKTPKKP